MSTTNQERVMSGSNTFFKRYGNLFKSPEQHAAEQAEWERRHEEWLEKNRKRLEREERRKAELRIVENDEQLRPYQLEAVKEILSAWHDVKNVMLQMPTGTGKTRLFVALINALNTTEAKNYKVRGVPRFLIITHREELVEQISETLNEHYHLNHLILGKKRNLSPTLSRGEGVTNHHFCFFHTISFETAKRKR